jgi:hypothetical protein
MATIVTRILCLAAIALVPAASAADAALPELAYVADGDVWAANADGSAARRLTTNGSVRWAAWSPDGTRIAFVTRRDGAAAVDLHVVEPDGSPRRLTAPPLAVPFGAEPAWSPDSAKLALVTRDAAVRSEISVIALDGDVRRLAADGEGQSVEWASAETLVYATFAPRPEVRAVSSTTGASRLVVRGWSPALSPDRSRLAYIAGGEAPAVHVSEPGGARPRALPVAGVRPATSPVWSPDGTRLAVVGRIPANLTGRYSPQYYSHLWLLDAGSGSARRVTGFPGDTTVANFGGLDPSWWPGGGRLLFHGDGPAGGGLHLIQADGRCLQPFRALPDTATSVAWRPGATPPTPPLRCVDLWTRASLAATEVARGQPVRVTVTVRNVGNAVAPAARLALARVVGGRVGTVATTHGTCSAGAIVADGCNLGVIAPASEARVSLTLVTDRPGAVGTQATAFSDGEPDVRGWNDGAGIAGEVSVCSIVGTWSNDALLGTRRSDHICGRPGADRIDGAAGHDRIEAGSGADTVTGGSGRDSVLGGGGPDVVIVRDGERDTVACGTERDTVVADRSDRIARDCERVVRR